MSLAFIFPGQGSQSVGMLRELAAYTPLVADTFAQASRVLGYDLWNLVQNGSEEKLNATEKTQPALLAAGVAVWRVWNASGGARPLITAGHSLGEYTALVCSGAIDFDAAVGLVAERGRCMQNAVPPGEGAMAAVLGLEQAVLEDICARNGGDQTVSCANLNAPGQIVIAGHKAAVERAIAAAKAAGAKRAVVLPVSVPSHSALMKPAAEQFGRYLSAIPIRTPATTVIHNADVAAHSGRGDIITALSRQLFSPVRWIETIRELKRRGVTAAIEAGPGRVLAGLCKRIEPDIECLPVFDPATLQSALARGN